MESRRRIDVKEEGFRLRQALVNRNLKMSYINNQCFILSQQTTKHGQRTTNPKSLDLRVIEAVVMEK